ncbi:AP2/ERF domain-containing protein PFD0985w-like isoform X2 [Adelges cooleyi]|uniref:AP2/ERF domain-containing protein PFD0985w-like isoform X2 n=1 Tax=Adelges cooleyi TaxID=133065 RepID=UPI00217F6E1C|nr:AP2/ERF domain-containing protein PFD0985w-like isoform X2 [Adelges cooleyi]
MCDQTNPYVPGDWVWVNLGFRYWWPARVVDPASVPKEVVDDKAKKSKKLVKKEVCTVQFEKEKSYFNVYDMKNIYIYSCDRKSEFLEKGFSLYMANKKGLKKTTTIDMTYFMDDVLCAETSVGGNSNIFKKLEQQYIQQQNIKSLFLTKKEVKQKEIRKSLPSVANNKSFVKTLSSTPRSQLTQMSPASTGNFKCHLVKGCTFSSIRYENLKRHMATHKTENETTIAPKNLKIDSIKPTTSKPNTSKAKSNAKTSVSAQQKRKNVKINKTDNKKIKLQNEILKDWEDDDTNESDDNNDTKNHNNKNIDKSFLTDEDNHSLNNKDIEEDDPFEKIKDLEPNKNLNSNNSSSRLFVYETIYGSQGPKEKTPEKNIVNSQASPPVSPVPKLKDFDDLKQAIDDQIEKSNLLLQNTTGRTIKNLDVSSLDDKIDDSNNCNEDKEHDQSKQLDSNGIDLAIVNSEEVSFEKSGEKQEMDMDIENGNDVPQPYYTMSELPTPEWAQEKLMESDPHSGIEEASSFSAKHKKPTGQSTTPTGYLKEPRPLFESDKYLIDTDDEVSSNKTSTETGGGSEDHSRPESSNFQLQ